MNKLYFYGGAFNPMTLAHLEIINNILNEMDNDDWLTIGITEHDYKTFDYSYSIREYILTQNLLKYATPPFKHVRILKQDKRTWNFLHEIFDEEKQKNIVLVIGEDEYNDLKDKKWHYSKEILSTYQIKTISRTNNISATKVRELIAKNADFKELKKYITKTTYNILKNNTMF